MWPLLCWDGFLLFYSLLRHRFCLLPFSSIRWRPADDLPSWDNLSCILGWATWMKAASVFLLQRICPSSLLLSIHLPTSDANLCFYLFISFWAVLDLCCYLRAFSTCGEWGLLLVVVHGWASHCRGFLCCCRGALGHAGFGSYSAPALVLWGMWNLLWPEVKPVSPALTGRFLTTGPPGKSSANLFEAALGGRHGHGASSSTVGFTCLLSLRGATWQKSDFCLCIQ